MWASGNRLSGNRAPGAERRLDGQGIGHTCQSGPKNLHLRIRYFEGSYATGWPDIKAILASQY